MRSNVDKPAIIVLAWVTLGLAACQGPDTYIASACADGVCPQSDSGENAPACLVSSTTDRLWILGSGPWQMCLPRPLPVDDMGRVACQVSVRLGELDGLGAGDCTERGFQPVDDTHPNHCLVPQLTRQERSEGKTRGWFYGDADPRSCNAHGVAIELADELVANGDVWELECWRAQVGGEDGSPADIDIAECAAARGVEDDVGNACLPGTMPEGGYDDREVYVQTGAADCDGGACLVYHVFGDPSPSCVPRIEPQHSCTDERTIADRMYCSCRCDAPEGDPGPFCDCPDQFTCVEVLPSGRPGVRGSYCVRDGTFTAD